MSPFTWNVRLFRWRMAYSPCDRHTMQEYNGWWNHIAFGLYVFTRKAVVGWVRNEP
jgi:hypothetical protein